MWAMEGVWIGDEFRFYGFRLLGRVSTNTGDKGKMVF